MGLQLINVYMHNDLQLITVNVQSNDLQLITLNRQSKD